MRHPLYRFRPCVVFHVFTLLPVACLWATGALAGGVHGGEHSDGSPFGKPGNASQVSRTVDMATMDHSQQ